MWSHTPQKSKSWTVLFKVCWKDGEVGQLLINMIFLAGECLQNQQITIQLTVPCLVLSVCSLWFLFHAFPFPPWFILQTFTCKFPWERKISKTWLQVLLLETQALPTCAMMPADSLTMRWRAIKLHLYFCKCFVCSPIIKGDVKFSTIKSYV